MADNLFSQLDKLGLGNLKDMELYEKAETKAQEDKSELTVEEKKIVETDFIFDKTYKCPVCDSEFKAKAVKTGRAKLLSIDPDLRPKYQEIDALKYDCIVCTRCGYASLSRFFNYVTNPQVKAIKENISITYKPDNSVKEIYTYEDAITRHQLALANAVVKKSKPSEKAYICLKLAWLIRGMAESIPSDAPDRDKRVAELNGQEKQYISSAYKGFMVAMSKEVFPICGMDEWTYIYLQAELARQCEDYTTCMKLVSDIIVSNSASPKLKDKARILRKALKDKIV